MKKQRGCTQQRPRPFRVFAGALLVFVALSGLSGCKGLGFFQGLKNAEIIQDDNAKAQHAAELANEQCAAAASHKAQAQLMADQTAAYANQASQLAQQNRDAVDLHSELTQFLDGATARLEPRLAAFTETRAEFMMHCNDAGFVWDSERLGDVIPDAGAFASALLQLTRGMLTAAEDFNILLATRGSAISNHVTPPPDPAALAAGFHAAADQMVSDAIMVTSAEYTVPNDMDQRIGEFKWPDVRMYPNDMTDEYESFQEGMGNLHSLGSAIADHQYGHFKETFDHWDAIQRFVDQATGGINASVQKANDQVASISKETKHLSAEAVRHSILAYQICHDGELPPGVKEEDLAGYDLENPFDGRANPYPAWNSTFWDISSP